MHEDNSPSPDWLLMSKRTFTEVDNRFGKAKAEQDEEFVQYMDNLKGQGRVVHLTPFQMGFLRQQLRHQGALEDGFEHPKLPDPESFGVVNKVPASIPDALREAAQSLGGFVFELNAPQVNQLDPTSPAWTAYRDQCDAILAGQPAMVPEGIPEYKLHCPSRWVITPEELTAAIRVLKDEWQGEIVADAGQAAPRAAIIYNAFWVALQEIAPGPEDFTVGGEVVLHRAIEILQQEDMATPSLGAANEMLRSTIAVMRQGIEEGGLVVA